MLKVFKLSAKKPGYGDIFDQPGLTRKNFDKFMNDIDMLNNNDLVGKEKF